VKKINWMLAVLALVGFGLAGCKKADKPVDSVQVNGVSVDMPKFQKTFSTVTNPDVQKLMFDVDQGFRYGDYGKAMAALDELSNKPDLTDEQKKVATDVLEQLKKLPNAAPAAAPAQ
jgi:hypothetical protein